MTPCFGAHQKRVEAPVKSIDEKKISVIINVNDVTASEIKQIMDFIKELRTKNEHG